MEEKIIKEIVDNSLQLISCATISGNFDEFDKAFQIIKEQLNDYYIREVIVGDYKNLIISNTESKDLDIIFCCHIDVVPNDKYNGIIKDNKLLGRGSFDMKSQLSVVMSLLKNNKSDKKIAFFISSDEETGGYCCKTMLEEYNASLAVIPDGGKNFELIVEEKGLLQFNIHSTGISAHASEPYKGKNAILTNMEIYYKLLEKYTQPKSNDDFRTTINLSKINGGGAVNMVAAESTITLDVRFTKDFDQDVFFNYVKEIAPNSEIEIIDQGPMFYVNSNTPLIVDFLDKASNILGYQPKISKCVATSDAIYFSEKGIPTILINPKGDFWHTKDEYVEIDSLYSLYLLFKSLI